MTFAYTLPPGFNLTPAFRWILTKDLQTNPFDRMVIAPGDRVMDCGAAIGTFTAAALEAGAGLVRAYEPLPVNVEVLRQNVGRYGERAEIVPAALVPDRRPTAWLETGSSFPGTHSIVTRAKNPKGRVEAAATNFRDEVLRLRPQVIKLDVEGAEYDLLATLRPGDFADLTCCFIEFHPWDHQDAAILRVRRFLAGEGMVCVKSRKRAFTALRESVARAQGYAPKVA